MNKPLRQRSRSLSEGVRERLKSRASQDCKNTVLINSEGVVTIAPQISQHARLMKFVFGLVPFVEKADFEGFRQYVEQSFQELLIPKGMRTRYLGVDQKRFNDVICRTFFSQEEYFTIFIKNGSGFEINPKMTKKYGSGVYWHLTLHEVVRGGTKTRSQKDRIILRFISQLCSGTEEEFFDHKNISMVDQTAYDYFMFTEYAQVNGLYLSFHRSLVQEDMMDLLRGPREQKLRVMSKIKHRLSVQTTFNTDTQELDAIYPVNLDAVRLFESRKAQLPIDAANLLYGYVHNIKYRVKELNRLQINAQKMLHLVKKYGVLKAGGENVWLQKHTKRALIKRTNYMYGFFRYLQNDTVSGSTNIKDFICSVHTLIVRDINRENQKFIKNQQKLDQLNENLIVLGWIVPEYERLIEVATMTGEPLNVLINREELGNRNENVDIFSRA